MLAMDKIKDIRFRYFVKGEKISRMCQEIMPTNSLTLSPGFQLVKSSRKYIIIRI